MFRAIRAASIGIVPEPQKGSKNGREGVHTESSINAAARVSLRGATALYVR